MVKSKEQTPEHTHVLIDLGFVVSMQPAMYYKSRKVKLSIAAKVCTLHGCRLQVGMVLRQTRRLWISTFMARMAQTCTARKA